MPLPRILPDSVRRLIGLPERDRLTNFITETWADFDREVHNGKNAPAAEKKLGACAVTEPWARSAYQLLLRAESRIANRNIEQGWAAALAAQRAILSKPNNWQRLERTATVLRHEAERKITGWREKAIRDLICDSNGKLIKVDNEERAMRVLDAVALRDDFSQNNWFKIVLRRRYLFTLCMILWSVIFLVLACSSAKILPDFLWDTKVLITVVLFGFLGAVVSVAQSLMAKDVSDRIPVQRLGASDVWMRPGIGAAASLIVLVLLHANKHFNIFTQFAIEPQVIVVLSLVAGYSERFIVGALDRISNTVAKKTS
jgi:hypothetical protein